MADWIFEGNPRHYNPAAVASSREQWWGTPHFRDQMAVDDRSGCRSSGRRILASTTRRQLPRRRTSMRLRRPSRRTSDGGPTSGLTTGWSCRCFGRSWLWMPSWDRSGRSGGFEGSNVPVPPDIASASEARAAAGGPGVSADTTFISPPIAYPLSGRRAAEPLLASCT